MQSIPEIARCICVRLCACGLACVTNCSHKSSDSSSVNRETFVLVKSNFKIPLMDFP